MSEIENLRTELEAMTKRVIMLEQFINSATRSEPAGTTTVGALTNISDTQLADNPVLYVELECLFEPDSSPSSERY
ncbi:hypothetical protein V3H24_09630 [Vibrio parahaemolyticus]|uniref:hypothetical protein n=1 Tax=Vibrio parahaemolyticus TaxID=670 RepID=UPI003B67472A